MNQLTLEAFGGNEQRAKVFLDRYSLKDSNGNPSELSPESMWLRVGYGIGKNGMDGDRFTALLRDFKLVPGGRILAGAGTGTKVTFYNCYVVPVETSARRAARRGELLHGVDFIDHGNDSREAIIDTIGVMVDILSRGGGVGVNWSVLRPKGAYLTTLNATSSGPIDWMHMASTAVGTVEQGGSRRGAAMFMLDDWHPDVLDFINAKRDLTRITNANISVAVSDDFMRAVEEDTSWDFQFPDTTFPRYNAEWDGDIIEWLGKGYPVKTYGTIMARELWRKLAEAAWDNGEPGVVFLDRYNEMSTAKGVERLISVNPCGEQGLGPYSVCNLGAMNLAAYIIDEPTPKGREYGSTGKMFNWPRFTADVKDAVDFLDRVIDENYYFLPENEEVQKQLRRIGLSVMGLADALIYLGIRYGSPEAVEFTEMVFRTMKDAAIQKSAELAITRGPAPAWEREMVDRPYLAEYFNRHPESDPERFAETGLRNLFLLTQAPTGTTSILAGVNSGIEPFFALGYWRTDRTGKHWVEPAAVTWALSQEGYPDDILVSAGDVSVEEHIAMQAAVQKYVDSSVSKTINAPNSHTIEDVEKAYTLAYKSGLKGLAYFRDGCGRAQVLSTSDAPSQSKLDELERRNTELVRKVDELQDKLDKSRPNGPYFVRPNRLTGTTHKAVYAGGNAYVTVNRDGGGVPVEVFVNVGKTGEEVSVLGEALGRVVSLALQRGTELKDIAGTLYGVGGVQRFGRSLPHAIAVALNEELDDDRWVRVQPDILATLVSGLSGYSHHIPFVQRSEAPYVDITYTDSSGPETEEWAEQKGDCPNCSEGKVVREEGCSKCHSCGWSAC